MRRSLMSSVPGCHLLFFLLILVSLVRIAAGQSSGMLVDPDASVLDEESVSWYDIRSLNLLN